MDEPAWDLRTESVLTVRETTGTRLLSLAGALAGLDAGGVLGFEALRPHQQHAWYAFLVQIAAVARIRSAGDLSAWTEARWTDALLALGGGQPEAWCLVVADLSKPAFLQPPVPEGTLAALKNTVEEADSIDILVTAKNHDLKSARMERPSPEQWAFVLTTLQTCEGYGGAGNYGIARMNGGFSSRPCVAVRAGSDLPTRFRRDVRVLVRGHAKTAAEHGYLSGGDVLLWLTPWDGTSSQALGGLDPWFVEVCRRVRLTRLGDRVVARTNTSKAARLAAKERKGNTGDPWTPIRRADLAALTVGSGGFSYALAQELLFGSDWEPGIAQRVYSDDPQPLAYLLQGLTRGQGKTEGLHERVIPVPPRAAFSLLAPPSRDRTGARAKARVADAGDVRKKVLRPALCALLQGGPEKLQIDDDRPAVWAEAFDREVDGIFFESLWNDLDVDDEAAQLRWRAELGRLAQLQLQRAIESCPLATTKRWRAIAAAERFFSGALRKLHPRVAPAGDEHVHA